MKAVSQCSGATGESEILWPQSQHQLCLHLHSRARTAVRQRQTQAGLGKWSVGGTHTSGRPCGCSRCTCGSAPRIEGKASWWSRSAAATPCCVTGASLRCERRR